MSGKFCEKTENAKTNFSFFKNHHMLIDCWYCNVSVLSKDSWSSPIEREKGRNDAPLKVFVWGQIALTVDFASFLFWPDFLLSSCPRQLKKWPCQSIEWLWLFLGTTIYLLVLIFISFVSLLSDPCPIIALPCH